MNKKEIIKTVFKKSEGDFKSFTEELFDFLFLDHVNFELKEKKLFGEIEMDLLGLEILAEEHANKELSAPRNIFRIKNHRPVREKETEISLADWGEIALTTREKLLKEYLHEYLN